MIPGASELLVNLLSEHLKHVTTTPSSVLGGRASSSHEQKKEKKEEEEEEDEEEDDEDIELVLQELKLAQERLVHAQTSGQVHAQNVSRMTEAQQVMHIHSLASSIEVQLKAVEVKLKQSP